MRKKGPFIIILISLFLINIKLAYSVCGNQLCESGEEFICPSDCAGTCGDTICDPGLGETCSSCQSDCGVCCTPTCTLAGSYQCPSGQLQICQMVSSCLQWSSTTCSQPSDCSSCGSNMDCVGGSCVSACGNGVCGVNENCPADAVSCADNVCYEPTCTDGCGQTPVPNGQTDESCQSPSYCNGAGSCITSPSCPDTDGDGLGEGTGCPDLCPGQYGTYCRGCPQPSCGTCQQPACPVTGVPTCQNSPSTTQCGTKNCDSFDNLPCKDYNDVTRYCNGAGSCGNPACNSYTNAPATTQCGTKDCSSFNIFCRTYNYMTKYCDGSGTCGDPLCTSYTNTPDGTSCDINKVCSSGSRSLVMLSRPIEYL